MPQESLTGQPFRLSIAITGSGGSGAVTTGSILLAAVARAFGVAVAATQSGRIQTYLVVLAWALAAWIVLWEVVR